MTVTAPSTDVYGAKLDAQIATVQTLVNTVSPSKAVYPSYVNLLNSLQIAAIDHYMVTGWLNAATILATYSAPLWDKVGVVLTARIAALQAKVNSPPTMPAGNSEGFGSSGWTTILQNFQAQLYAAQITLVEHLMDFPGGTRAAIMLANLTGSQSFVFEYVFSSVGHDQSSVAG